MHLWRRLGIARPNKFVGLCARLAQTFVFNRRFPSLYFFLPALSFFLSP